jgi:hypothetical protein
MLTQHPQQLQQPSARNRDHAAPASALGGGSRGGGEGGCDDADEVAMADEVAIATPTSAQSALSSLALTPTHTRATRFYVCMYVYTYMYMNVYIYVYICMCIYIYIYRKRERERERARAVWLLALTATHMRAATYSIYLLY